MSGRLPGGIWQRPCDRGEADEEERHARLRSEARSRPVRAGQGAALNGLPGQLRLAAVSRPGPSHRDLRSPALPLPLIACRPYCTDMAEGVLREVTLALPMVPEMELEASKTAASTADSIRMSP